MGLSEIFSENYLEFLLNGPLTPNSIDLTKQMARGDFFVIIGESERILFSSPNCMQEYGLSAGNKLNWVEKESRVFVKLGERARINLGLEDVAIHTFTDQIWQGKKARMLILDDTPYRIRMINNISSEKNPRIKREYSQWISFQCKFDNTLDLIGIGEQPEEMTGYSAEELISSTDKAFRKQIPENYRAAIWEEIREKIELGQPYQVYYPFQKAGSQIRWFQEQGRARKGKEDSTITIVGWLLDITDRKIESETLNESETRYRSLIEASPDSVLMLDNTGCILLANKHFCEMIDVSEPELVLGKDISEFFDADMGGITAATVEEVVNSLPAVGNRMTLKLKTGESIPVEVNFASIKNDIGDTMAYIAVSRDIRQREETQKALRESEARYRAIVEENPEMVVRFDHEGKITFGNSAFCKYIGHTPNDLVGKKLDGKLTGPGHHLLQKLKAQLAAGMGVTETEFSLRNSKGGENWYRWKTIEIKDTSGQFIEYQAVGEDITEQKKAYLNELESQNRLREIMENVKLISIILDAEGKLTFCNTCFLDIVGYKREEVLQKDWIATFIPPDQATELRKILFESATRGNLPIRNDNPILTRSGESRLISWYNTILRNTHGEYEGIASIGEDITERTLSDALRETILKIAQSANQAEDLDTLFQSIHDALKKLMPVDNFFIALYDAEKDILSFPFFRDAYDPQPLPDKPKRGLTEYVLRTGKTTLVNPETFEKLVEAGEVESIGTASLDWIGVPLKIENRTIGVMVAQTYSPGVRYEAREQQLLTFVSNQVAMAIDRKRAEQALRDSQKRSELLVAASKDAILIGTLDGAIMDFNEVSTEMYGYSREELLRLNITDLIPADVLEEHPNYIDWEFQMGGEIHDVRNKRKDGSEFPVDVSMRKVTTTDGEVYIAYIRDITEQKQAAQVIIESEEKFRTLAENSAAGIFIHSGGRHIYVNPMWSAITEFSMLELLQKKPTDFIDSHLPKHEREKLASRLMGENLPDRFEFELITHYGEKRVIDLNLTSIRFEEKNAIMGTAIDITTRKQREHELEVIAQMSEALRISINQNDVMETSISKICDILKIDGAYIAIGNEQSREVEMKIGWGVWKQLEGTILPIYEGLSGHIITTSEFYINHHPQNDPYVTRPDLAVNMKIIAGMPLIAAGRTIGVLVIGSKQNLSENEIRLFQAMGDFTASALHRADLFEQSSLQARELEQAYNSTLEGWALALELRDKETQGHSVRIANLTLKLAKRMGIPETEMENIRRGALLHDIGKLGVPDTILLKHSTLTPSEWAIMQRHPTYAFEMLSQLKDFKDSIDIPYCHHEWWDGSGYPRGLEGEDIPLAARIFCIVDVWDALTSDRPYRQAWDRQEALAHIINQAGTHFDPRIVNEFIKMIVEDK
jgi:PAS domain S-box-containing protein/putative nucleotidyltransferase with HDIG domain